MKGGKVIQYQSSGLDILAQCTGFFVNDLKNLLSSFLDSYNGSGAISEEYLLSIGEQTLKDWHRGIGRDVVASLELGKLRNKVNQLTEALEKTAKESGSVTGLQKHVEELFSCFEECLSHIAESHRKKMALVLFSLFNQRGIAYLGENIIKRLFIFILSSCSSEEKEEMSKVERQPRSKQFSFCDENGNPINGIRVHEWCGYKVHEESDLFLEGEFVHRFCIDDDGNIELRMESYRFRIDNPEVAKLIGLPIGEYTLDTGIIDCLCKIRAVQEKLESKPGSAFIEDMLTILNTRFFSMAISGQPFASGLSANLSAFLANLSAFLDNLLKDSDSLHLKMIKMLSEHFFKIGWSANQFYELIEKGITLRLNAVSEARLENFWPEVVLCLYDEYIRVQLQRNILGYERCTDEARKSMEIIKRQFLADGCAYGQRQGNWEEGCEIIAAGLESFTYLCAVDNCIASIENLERDNADVVLAYSGIVEIRETLVKSDKEERKSDTRALIARNDSFRAVLKTPAERLEKLKGKYQEEKAQSQQPNSLLERVIAAIARLFALFSPERREKRRTKIISAFVKNSAVFHAPIADEDVVKAKENQYACNVQNAMKQS